MIASLNQYEELYAPAPKTTVCPFNKVKYLELTTASVWLALLGEIPDYATSYKRLQYSVVTPVAPHCKEKILPFMYKLMP